MREGEERKILRLKVDGMGCDGCVEAVQKALEDVPGVVRAMVELNAGLAEVEATPMMRPETLVEAVQQAGYEASLA